MFRVSPDEIRPEREKVEGNPRIMNAVLRRNLFHDLATVCSALRDRLALFQSWDVFALEAELKSFAESEQVGFGKIGPPMRAALTAGSTSPDIARTLSALGRDESLGRLDDALQQTK